MRGAGTARIWRRRKAPACCARGWAFAVSFRSPMAVAVIGGLITSTFLSLLVIPAVFTYVDDFAEWVKRRWHRGGHGAPASMPQQS